MLEGFGAGYQGRTPPYVQEEHAQRQFGLQQERVGLERERVGLERERMGQESTRFKAQMEQVKAQMSLEGVKLIQEIRKLGLDDAQLQPFVDAASKLFSFAAQGGPEADLVTPTNIKEAMKTPGHLESYLTNAPYITAKDAAVLKPIFLQDAAKGRAEMEKMAASNRQRLIGDSLSKLDAVRRQQGATLVTFDSAMAALDPLSARAIRDGLQNGEIKEGTLRAIGIQDPRDVAAAEKAGLTTTAQEGAKAATPLGRADLAAKEAATAASKAQTARAGIFTVPGQGGSLVQVPGISPTTPGLPSQPGTQGGLTTAPGTNVLAQTPGPGATPEVAKTLSSMEQGLSQLKQVLQTLKTGEADKYLGPGTSRPWAAFKEWAVKNLPSAVTGGVPDTLSDLEQAAAIVKNITIFARTGAAVREAEEPRLLAEVPDKQRDKPEAFKRKLVNSIANAEVLVKRYRELVGPDGRLKAGVDPDAVAKKFPLPSLPNPKKPSDMSDDELREALKGALP